MSNGTTELVFVLDRSGSMSGLERDTIGGFNSLLERQQTQPGDCVVTTVLFDDRYELLHDRVPLSNLQPMTENEYYARGSTALLDAIGRTIDKTANAQSGTLEAERANKVLFVIITDGQENASREYRCNRINEMITDKKERFGWEFLFLGANMDAISVASTFGIGADRAVSYRPDSMGTSLNYDGVSEAARSMREDRPIRANWKSRIQAHEKRE